MHLASSFPLVLWSIALSGLPPSATLFWLGEDNARGLGESELYILRVKTDAHVELSLKKWPIYGFAQYIERTNLCLLISWT